MKTIFAVLGCISVLTLASFNLKGQSQSRDNVLRDIEEKRAELQKLEEQFLAPPEADRINYAEFLSQPNTGLLRLLPREIYESDTNKANKKTLTLRGGGAYFSFTTLSHEYDNATDIGLEQGYLQIGFAGADY